MLSTIANLSAITTEPAMDEREDIGGSGVLEFVADAAHARAGHYRERAEQLRDMAKTESLGRLRGGLLNLADQYESLAASVELKPL
jgi:hypothetical protein